jgi:hypothetical protein
MTDEISITKAIVGSLITFVLGLFGIQTRQNSRDIKEFPEKYVLKTDYYQQGQQTLDELRGIRTDLKDSQERIHDRIDDVHTRINQKGG